MAMRVMTVGDLLEQQSQQQSGTQSQPGFRTMTVGELLSGADATAAAGTAGETAPRMKMSELPPQQRMSGRDMSPQHWLEEGMSPAVADMYAEGMARYYRTEFQRGQEAIYGVQDKTWGQAIGHGLGHGGLNVLRDVAAKAKEVIPAAYYILSPLSRFTAAARQEEPWEARALQWVAGQAESAAEAALAAHPEWTPMEINSASELLENPKLLANTLSEMAPFSGGALAANVLGGPEAGFAFSAAVEAQVGRHEALNYFVEENAGKPLSKDQIDKANQIGDIYGVLAGAIETAQVGHILKSGSKAKRALIKRGLKNLYKKGGKLTVETLGLALTEAAEEMAQSMAYEATAAVVGEIPIVKEGDTLGSYVDAKLQEGIPAAISSVGTAGLLAGGAATLNGGSGQRAAEHREAHLAHNAIENAIAEATAAAEQQKDVGVEETPESKRSDALRRRGGLESKAGMTVMTLGELKDSWGQMEDLVGDPLKPPADLTDEEFVRETERVWQATNAAEKNKDRAMTEEEIELWDEGRNWREFSEKQGYSENEIADYERWLELMDDPRGQKTADNLASRDANEPTATADQMEMVFGKQGPPKPLSERQVTRQRRADDLAESVTKNIKGTYSQQFGGGRVVRFANGQMMFMQLVDEVEGDAALLAERGQNTEDAPRGRTVTAAPGAKLTITDMQSGKSINVDALIEYGDGTYDRTTERHEPFHVAWQYFLTDQEKQILLDAHAPGLTGIEAEEAVAKAFEKREEANTRIAAIMQKIRDGLRSLYESIKGARSAESVLRDVEKGTVWQRKGAEGTGGKKFQGPRQAWETPRAELVDLPRQMKEAKKKFRQEQHRDTVEGRSYIEQDENGNDIQYASIATNTARQEFTQMRERVIAAFGLKDSKYDRTSARKFVDAQQKAEAVTPEQVAAWHKRVVAQAVAAGKDVPAEVLADYPELAGRQPAPAQKPKEGSPSSLAKRTEEGKPQQAPAREPSKPAIAGEKAGSQKFQAGKNKLDTDRRDAILGDTGRQGSQTGLELRESQAPGARAATVSAQFFAPTIAGGDSNGRISAAGVRYQTRDLSRWAARFREEKLVNEQFTSAEIEQFIADLEKARQHYDLDLLPQEAGGNPLRGNIDYIKSFDLTTLCPRHDQYVAVIDSLQKQFGRIFDPHERVRIAIMMQEYGWMPACMYCYSQQGRDRHAASVVQAVQIYNDASAILRSRKPDKTQLATDKRIWGKWNWWNKAKDRPTLLWDIIKRRYRKVPRLDVIEMTDLIYGKTTTDDPLMQEMVSTVRTVAQGAVKANQVKGYAPVERHGLTMDEDVLDAANKRGGVRLNSNTDFRIWHTIDLAQLMAQLQARGAKMHVYTRVVEFVEMFGDTGIKFNIDLEFAHDENGKIIRDAQGKPLYDSMNAMDYESAMRLRREHSDNVGSMLVAMTDEDIAEGLTNPDIDMMIPYHHTPGASPLIKKYLHATDYTREQSETVNGKKIDEHIYQDKHKNDRETYLKYCDDRGYTPRFARWRNHPNYMKMISDVARNPSSQSVVDVSKINWAKAHEYLDRWVAEGGDAKTQTPNKALVQMIGERIAKDDWPVVPGETTQTSAKVRYQGAVRPITGSDIDLQQEELKQPWEMTKEEFDRYAHYHGTNKSAAKDIKKTGILKYGQVAAKSDKRVTQAYGDEQFVVFRRSSGLPGYQQGGKGFFSVAEGDQSPAYQLPNEEAQNDPHRWLVQQALSEGKSVPAEVLADYPDLPSSRDAVKVRYQGAVRPITSNDIESMNQVQLERVDRIMRNKGYDVRGATDARKIMRKLAAKSGELWHEDWSDAVRQATGRAQPAAQPDTKKAEQRAVRKWGTTGNIKEAGYILTSGAMLDMSGKREGGDRGMRAFDHRQINEFFDEHLDGYEAMQAFIGGGNIRIGSGGLIDMDATAAPNTRQLIQLGKFIRAADGQIYLDMGPIVHREYRRGTAIPKIIGDIKRHYAGDDITAPRPSDFRYQAALDKPGPNDDNADMAQDKGAGRTSQPDESPKRPAGQTVGMAAYDARTTPVKAAQVIVNAAKKMGLEVGYVQTARTGSAYFDLHNEDDTLSVRVATHEPNYALRRDADLMVFVGKDGVGYYPGEGIEHALDTVMKYAGQPLPPSTRGFVTKLTKLGEGILQKKAEKEATKKRENAERAKKNEAIMAAALKRFDPQDIPIIKQSRENLFRGIKQTPDIKRIEKKYGIMSLGMLHALAEEYESSVAAGQKPNQMPEKAIVDVLGKNNQKDKSSPGGQAGRTAYQAAKNESEEEKLARIRAEQNRPVPQTEAEMAARQKETADAFAAAEAGKAGRAIQLKNEQYAKDELDTRRIANILAKANANKTPEQKLSAWQKAIKLARQAADLAINLVEPTRRAQTKFSTAIQTEIIKMGMAGEAGKVQWDYNKVAALGDITFAEFHDQLEQLTDRELADIYLVRGRAVTDAGKRLQDAARSRISPLHEQYAKALKEIYDANYAVMQKLGLDVLYFKDYFYGAFKNEKEAMRVMAMFRRSTDRFTKKKMIPTVADALAFGLKLRDRNPVANAGRELSGIHYLMAMRTLKERLKQMCYGTGVIDEIDASEEIKRTWKQIYGSRRDEMEPTFGTMWVHPDLARPIRSLISVNRTSSGALKIFRDFTHTLNGLKFLVPFFHARTIMAQAMVDGGIRGLITGEGMHMGTPFKRHDPRFMTPEYIRYVQLGGGHSSTVEVQSRKMLQQLMTSTYGNWAAGSTIKKAAAGAFRVVRAPARVSTALLRKVNEFVFDAWIPAVKYAKYHQELARFEARNGRPANDSERIAIIKEGQNFYGEMNEKLFGRSATMTSVMRFAWLAPGFREGNYRTMYKGLSVAWDKQGGPNGRAWRSLLNIPQYLMFTWLVSQIGTLIMTGELPEPPEDGEEPEDYLRDMFKSKTGFTDHKGRAIYIDWMTSDKDYYEQLIKPAIQLVTGRPGQAAGTAVDSFVKTLGGMASTVSGLALDAETMRQGAVMVDWMGQRVYFSTDPTIVKIAKIAEHEWSRIEPIPVSSFRTALRRKVHPAAAAFTAVAGVRTTTSEVEKKRSELWRHYFDKLEGRESKVRMLKEHRLDQDDIDAFNADIEQIRNHPLATDDFKERMEKLSLKSIEYYEASEMIQSRDDALDEAVKLAEDKKLGEAQAVLKKFNADHPGAQVGMKALKDRLDRRRKEAQLSDKQREMRRVPRDVRRAIQ